MINDEPIAPQPDDDAVEQVSDGGTVEQEPHDDGDHGWQEEYFDLPQRPRRRLLTPAPVVLLCALLTAVGFIAGVRVEKGRASGASAAADASPFAAAFRRSARAGDGGAGATGGGPGGGTSSGPTIGKVASIDKNTLYVTNAQGNTIAVIVPSGLKVDKTVTVSAHEIHPGDTIVVQGSQGLKGNLNARSISITSGGGLGGFAASFGGAGNGAANAGGQGATGRSGSQPLFGG